MSVNEKIRLIRETKDLTQEQVAEKLGISPNTYGDIERGSNDPKLSKLQKLAEIFEMSLADLLDLGERGALNINFHHQGRNCTFILGSAIEKELALKDKELALQQREIALKDKQISHLEELLEMHKQKPNSSE